MEFFFLTQLRPSIFRFFGGGVGAFPGERACLWLIARTLLPLMDLRLPAIRSGWRRQPRRLNDFHIVHNERIRLNVLHIEFTITRSALTAQKWRNPYTDAWAPAHIVFCSQICSFHTCTKPNNEFLVFRAKFLIARHRRIVGEWKRYAVWRPSALCALMYYISNVER